MSEPDSFFIWLIRNNFPFLLKLCADELNT